MVADGVAQRGVAFDQATRYLNGLIRRIVENLDVQFVGGILQLADRLQKALDYVLFIENGELHGHARQVFEVRGRLGRAILAVLVVQVDQHVAVHSIPSQKNEHNEIRDQQRHIKCVGTVESAKCGIQKMLANVGPQAVGGG
jgi:hypothetical protein